MIDERLTAEYIDGLKSVEDLRSHAKILLFRDAIYGRERREPPQGRKFFYHAPCPRCLTGMRMWYSDDPVPSCCRECLEDC